MRIRSWLAVLVVASIAAQSRAATEAGFGEDLTYRCTNGRDPSQLGYRDYLKEFVAGPCAPVILAPGIGGSVMQVEVDCELLRFTDYETFLACGWLDCKAGSKLAPNKEYRIWVPHLDSPMTIVSPLDLNKIGVKVKVAGATPGTFNVTASACGLNSIKDLVPGIINPEVSGYFAAFVKRLRLMGYKEGLSIIGLPYDFRKGHAEDDFHPMLVRTTACSTRSGR